MVECWLHKTHTDKQKQVSLCSHGYTLTVSCPHTGVHVFGLCATALVTDVIQLATGYHAPFFLTVCKPNYTLPGVACDKNPYITQDICSGRDQYAILSARWIHTSNTMPSHICHGKFILLCLGCYLICILYLHIRAKTQSVVYLYAIHTHTICPCSVAYPMCGLNRMKNRFQVFFSFYPIAAFPYKDYKRILSFFLPKSLSGGA